MSKEKTSGYCTHCGGVYDHLIDNFCYKCTNQLLKLIIKAYDTATFGEEPDTRPLKTLIDHVKPNFKT